MVQTGLEPVLHSRGQQCHRDGLSAIASKLGKPTKGPDKPEMLTIRQTTKADAGIVLDFIRKLAEYERAPKSVVATEDDLVRDGFGPVPKFRCVIAEWDGVPAGFALYFTNYSTWLGRPGIYLEDLFVLPEMRGKGIGKGLLQYLAQVAVRENYYGVVWQVLDWNQLAIDFYLSIGARKMDEWDTMRMMGQAMKSFAEGNQSPATPQQATSKGQEK